MTNENSTNIWSNSNAKKHKHRKIAAVTAVVIVLLGAIAAVYGKQIYEKLRHDDIVASTIEGDTFYAGTVVQGVDLGGKTMAQAKAAVAAKESSLKGKYSIKITYESKNWELTEKDMEFSYNTDQVLKEAYAYARTGNREQRFKLINALRTTPKSYSLTKTLNEQDLKTKLKKIADSVSRAPVEPTVTAFNQSSETFSVKEGEAGLSADSDKLYTDVKNIIDGEKTGNVKLSVSTIACSKTPSQVKSNMKKLGTYSTVSKNGAAGTYNMSRALKSVNGVCVPAGGTFSFLSTVGSCDKAHGYYQAGAILKGKLVQQYGGGICQASTTIYGAAVRSNMAIVDRSNHSMPSSYCPIGQDATVSYPNLDFKFKNTSDYPIYIVTQTKNRVLTATFYGYQPPEYDSIKITSKITQTIPASAKAVYTLDSTLAKGVIRLDSKARTGYKATAARVFYKNGKVVKTEDLPSSYYKPSPAYYSYGKGTDLTKANSSVSTKPESTKPESTKPESTKPESAKPESTGSDVPVDDPAA